jgi:hypothetical protein
MENKAEYIANQLATTDAQCWRYIEEEILHMLAAREQHSPYRALTIMIDRGPDRKLEGVTVALVGRENK